MPQVKHVKNRLKALDKCLRDEYRYYDIHALVEFCNRELVRQGNQQVSERTIREDLCTIQNAPYFAELNDNLPKKPKIYRYKDTSCIIRFDEFTDSELESVRETIKLLEPLKDIPQYTWVKMVLHCVEKNELDFINRQIIAFQDNPDAVGRENFAELLSGIINNQTLEIEYKPFERDEQFVIIHPYYLKQYNNRWSLIAKTEGYDNISVYPLDRIKGIKIASVAYIPSDIDFDDYFETAVGVSIKPDKPIYDIVLRVSNTRYSYIETKPILPSQTELRSLRGENYRTILFKSQINKELVSLIMSFGSDVVVIEPQELKDKITSIISSMNKNYESLQKPCNDAP